MPAAPKVSRKAMLAKLEKAKAEALEAAPVVVEEDKEPEVVVAEPEPVVEEVKEPEPVVAEPEPEVAAAPEPVAEVVEEKPLSRMEKLKLARKEAMEAKKAVLAEKKALKEALEAAKVVEVAPAVVEAPAEELKEVIELPPLCVEPINVSPVEEAEPELVRQHSVVFDRMNFDHIFEHLQVISGKGSAALDEVRRLGHEAMKREEAAAARYQDLLARLVALEEKKPVKVDRKASVLEELAAKKGIKA